MGRNRCIVFVMGALMVGVWSARAEAQFYSGLLRGFSRLSAPTAPSGQRFGQFTLSEEPLMDGWRMDFNRSFGPDSVGRPNRLDLGPLDVSFNSGQVTTSAQYSKRFIPMAEFTSFTPQAINYSVGLNTGIEDFTIQNAQVAWNTSANINALGFYDYVLNASHRGDFELEGMLIDEHGSLDFDIGPVNMSGNIVGDVLAAITEPIFSATGQDNPFAQFSARATKRIEVENTKEGLTERAQAGEVLSADELSELLEATLVASTLDGEMPDFSFLGDEEFAATLEAVDVDLVEGGVDVVLGYDADGNVLVPEPGTVMFLLLAGAAMVVLRQRP